MYSLRLEEAGKSVASSEGATGAFSGLGKHGEMDSFVKPKPDKSMPEPSKRVALPNYFARSVQVRLLCVVASLMLVLALMFEARKPENWQWMWAGQQPQEVASQDQLETRLPAQSRDDLVGTVYAGTANSPSTTADPEARVLQQAWSRSLLRLSPLERAALDAVVSSGRDSATARPTLGDDWPPALEKLSMAWDEYLHSAQSTLMERPEEERLRWAGILAEAETRWRHEWLPTLTAASEARAWTPRDRAMLQRMQANIDRFSMDQVEDDSVFRGAEHPAWFRCLEDLASSTANEIRQRSLGRVSFLQLFRQPAEYRGRVVTIRGSARLAYRVSAPANTKGIDGYYVIWMKPMSGQLSPFIVYCLHLPPEFPAVREKDQQGHGTELSEELELDAFFFKRQAYQARDGLNTAPLLLAKVPRWLPAKPLSNSPPLPSISVAIASVAGVMLLAVGLAWLAYAPTRRRLRTSALPSETAFEELRDKETAPPVSEALRRMSRSADDDES